MSDERSDIARRLALYLDPGGDDSLARQIVDRVWLEVITGTLETGERLPTVRQLAVDLSVHPNIVARAYQELESLGVVSMRTGQGTLVKLGPPDRPAIERRAQLARLCRDIIAQSGALDVSVDEVVDMLTELRTSNTGAGRGGGPA